MAKTIKANCFNIVNFNGEPVLFRTDDVTVNKFIFTIINLTGEPLALKGGSPDMAVRAKLPATSEASTFSIDFEVMLTRDVVAGLKLTLPENWTAAYSPGDFSRPPSWSLAPVMDTILAVNDSLEFNIENIRCAETRPGNFEIMYSNIPGYPNSMLPVPKHLDVLTPPDPKKNTLPLKEGYINPVHPISGQQFFIDTDHTDGAANDDASEAVPVYITYDAAALIENGFTYILTNTSKTPLVPANEAAGSEPPVLYISFVFGDEDYAVTTQSLGDNNISINVNAKLPWQPVAHTGGTSYWSFFPQSERIMEGLETIQFPIKKIITPLNIPADTISILYIQLNNIPGYNDAAYTVQMQKKAAVAKVEDLRSDKHIIQYGENIRLTWVSALAKRITIEYETRDKQLVVLDSEKGDIKLSGKDFLLPVAPSAEYTVIRAKAYGHGSQTDHREITITVNQVPASIDFFTAAPQLINIGTSTEVVLQWKTENARSLKLVTPDGLIDVTDKTSIPVKLNDAFAFTLEAWSYGTQFPAPTRLQAKVMGWKALSPIALALTREVMQTTPAVLFNEKSSRVYTLNAVNNTIYNINSATGRQEQAFSSTALALSGDGMKLWAVVPDRLDQIALLYDMRTGVAVEKTRVPLQYDYLRHLVCLSSGSSAYCTVTAEHRGKQWDNFLLWLYLDQENKIKVYRIDVNKVKNFPGKLCLSHDEGLLYVVVDETTLMIVMTAHFGIFDSIKLPGPISAMISGRSVAKLYVACPSVNKVVVIETQRSTVAGTIEIPDSPSGLVFSPDDKFLCVACFGSDKVVIVDTATDKIVSSVTVGKNPIGLCFSSDGKLLFVTNYCSKTLSVVDFINLRVLQTIPTGEQDGNPFDVAALSDGQGYKIYVTKESWSQRISCPNPKANTTDNITVLSIVKPANTLPE